MKKKINKCLEVFPKNKEKVRKNLCQFNLIKEKKQYLILIRLTGISPQKTKASKLYKYKILKV